MAMPTQAHRPGTGDGRAARSRLRPTLVVGISVLLVVAGCGRSSSFGVDLRQEAWTSNRPANYEFVYFTGGALCEVTRARIVVEDNVPVAVTPIDNGCGEVTLADAPTIDGVFSRLVRSYETASRVGVTWDKTYGFPAVVDVDAHLGATDGGSTYGVEDYVPH